jgi:2-iminobutanoate/2-iminopropanoate deaminase
MKQAVQTHLAPLNAPLEWAVTADGVFYTALIAVHPDGTMETGDIRAQTALTLDNLKLCLEAANGTMDDVVQCLIYLTSKADAKGMNEVYATYFRKPFPNRATVVISELLQPGCIIEIVAYAHIGSSKSKADIAA